MSDFWRGMALPWNGTLATLVESKSDRYILASSILWIIMTRFGERVMLPEFGSTASEMVFEPNNEETANSFRISVQDALAKWDDRIELVGVSIYSKQHDLWCRIKWRRKKSGDVNIEETEFMLEPGFISQVRR